jgi:hypothetical protein
MKPGQEQIFYLTGESRSVLGSQTPPLGPGQTRSFQISFDRVPSSWNMQQPSVRVSYLRFASLK